MYFSTLVGMRTGPFTFRFFSLAPRIRSAQTEEHEKDKDLNKKQPALTPDYFYKPWLRIAYTVVRVHQVVIVSS